MLTIEPIPAFNDNYIWLIYNSINNSAIVVDPGDSKPVVDVIRERALSLVAILVTHHHYDHTNGVSDLVNVYNIPVYGPTYEAQSIVSKPLQEKDQITIQELELHFSIFDIPGHTKGHIAFFSDSDTLDAPILFSGDTLFSAGCGRLFEGTAKEMMASLNKLTTLPENTRIYCGHEYTLNNVKFALSVEPDNLALQDYLKTVTSLRKQNQPTLPSTLKLEIDVNPFLRCQQQSIIDSASAYSKQALTQSEAVFSIIRSWKDNV